MVVRADGEHYFGDDGFPVTIKEIGETRQVQHEYDLTEVKHCHNFSELVIITKGQGIQWVDGQDHFVAAGDIFLLQGEKEHYFKERKGLALYNVMFDQSRLSLPVEEFKKIPGYHALFILEPNYRQRHNFESKLHIEPTSLSHCTGIVKSIKQEIIGRKPGFEASTLSLMINLIVYLSRQYSHSKSTAGKSLLRIGEVIGKLERDYSNSWDLEMMAKIAHMSKSSLLNAFKEATSHSPVDYLIRIRIQKSMEMLRETALSISEISHLAGFSDSNYFSRQFRKITKLSPKEYRNKNLK